MTLFLDYPQRLNLITVLGACDVRGRELHALWHLQDLLDLNQDEKEAIGFREVTTGGQKAQYWNENQLYPACPFELSEADLGRIRKAIEEFPQFRGSRDRVWLEPLLTQLSGSAESENGELAVRDWKDAAQRA